MSNKILQVEDTWNRFAVGFAPWHQDRTISVGMIDQVRYMTPDDALVLAAWLVAIAELHAQTKFEDVLKQVEQL